MSFPVWPVLKSLNLQTPKNNPMNLPNGLPIPPIGFGTYKLPTDEEGVKVIVEAVDAGYRLIDCASAYSNQIQVGEGLRRSGLKRDELFVTSKVWNDERGYDRTLRSCEKSLRELSLGYLDLFLIHWPATDVQTPEWRKENADTWRALERLYYEKLVRAIGVSNFNIEHLEALEGTANVMPMVNQVELNPGMRQPELTEWCAEKGIVLEAWSPLGRGRIFGAPLLKDLAHAHSKSVAQIALRWEIQKGIIPIPKSSNSGRMKENLMVFDFSLTPAEMALIDSLPTFGNSGLTPENIDLR